jgi:gluconolactonase
VEGSKPVRLIAQGLGFLEGPLWTGEGLVVASVSRGLLYSIDGRTTELAEVGGNPTGLAVDESGAIWVAQSSGVARTTSIRPTAPGIQRVSAGVVDDVVTRGLDAPGDCALGPDGRLWFTDPVGPAMEREGPGGRLCAIDRETSVVSVLASDLRFPNGLAFSPDDASLYVAETGSGRVLRFECGGGELGAAAVLVELPDAHPDGLAVDLEGRVHVAVPNSAAILVVDDRGRLEETIDLDTGCFPTNVCFGGDDLATLYVTTARRGRVLAVRRDVPGHPLGQRTR